MAANFINGASAISAEQHWKQITMSRDLNTSKYPDWPASFRGYAPKKPTHAGEIQLPDLSGGPDPDEVLAWKQDRKANVTQTCEYFGLSRVQVMKVVGE